MLARRRDHASATSSSPVTPAPARPRSPSSCCFRTGAIPRLGSVDDGTAQPRLRARGAEAQAVADPRGRHVRARRARDHDHRHARLRRLRGRGRSRASRRSTRRSSRWTRRAASRRAPRRPSALGRSTGTAGLLRHHQVRPRERGPDGGARRAARVVRQQDRAAPPGHRQGRDVQRLRRPRPSQGLAVRGRQGGRDPDPGRPGGRGRAAARPAARGGRRGRRRRPDEVPRGRGDQRRGARRVPPQGRPRVDPGAGAGHLGRQGHRHRRRCSTRSCATCRRPTRRARSPPRTRPARTSRSPASGSRCSCRCSRPPPTRSSAA